jgi:hypothetical protein
MMTYLKLHPCPIILLLYNIFAVVGTIHHNLPRVLIHSLLLSPFVCFLAIRNLMRAYQ